MNRTVESGKTLLVDGPASVSVVSGRVEVFGFTLKHASKIVIREGKRLPFFAGETANFEIASGGTATTEEIDGNTIPQSWTEALELLKGFDKKPVIVMVIGKADSGKTSLCTYIINKLVGAKQRVAILDGDLGQSDIGPPCTIAYTLVSKPLTELYNLQAENGFFVGATSPSAAINETIEGAALMKTEILSKAVDFVVVNTDGWVEGEDALKYKRELAEKLQPNAVLCIQREEELKPLLIALEKFVKTAVQFPSTISPRSMEKRKKLREMSYAKYLMDAKVKSWLLNQVRIEEKNVESIKHGEEKGLLLGLYDSQGKFFGIGILLEVDRTRKTLKVLTPVTKKPAFVAVGKVRLDENLREIVNALE